MKLIIAFIVAAFLLASTTPLLQAAPKSDWTGLRTKHFFLIGNADEREIKLIAMQLEQFREVFAREFAGAALNSPVPTTVVVFKSDAAFRPYKPVFEGRAADIDGYFQGGLDVNYITISVERRRENPYAMIFHESVHLLVDNKLRSAPGWVNEGMAEYYSTFEVLVDKKGPAERRVLLGKPILNHILLLRRNKLLPLETLFAIDRSSPYYNERQKSTMFYAQAWALVHYLTHGNEGRRRPQLAHFLELLSANAPVGSSFQKAFQSDYKTLERELREYIGQNSYRVDIVPVAEKQDALTNITSVPLSEAVALAHLGDLLLHIGREADAEKHLQRALALAPELSMAHATLGMLREGQRRFPEAKQHLQRAIKTDPQNYLAHYYYAFAVSREAMDSGQTVYGYEKEAADAMRASLKRAIELAPGFPESYRLLAFVHLATNTQLEEATALLERGLKLSPGRHEFAYVLAQVQLRRRDFKAARTTLEEIIAGSTNQHLREQARDMLEQVLTSENNQPKP